MDYSSSSSQSFNSVYDGHYYVQQQPQYNSFAGSTATLAPVAVPVYVQDQLGNLIEQHQTYYELVSHPPPPPPVEPTGPVTEFPVSQSQEQRAFGSDVANFYHVNVDYHNLQLLAHAVQLQQQSAANDGPATTITNTSKEENSNSSLPSMNEEYHDDFNENKENIPITEGQLRDIDEKYKKYRFPIKLWYMASDEQFSALRWSHDGKNLVINQTLLEPTLQILFRSSKFASFIRQLHLYGFRKTSRNKTLRRNDEFKKLTADFISEYQCQNFQRGHLEQAKLIKRSYSKSGGS